MYQTKIIFLEEDYNKFRSHLLREDNNEWAAFAYVEKDNLDPNRIYVRKLILIGKEHYDIQSPGFNSIRPESQWEIINQFLEAEESGLLEIHSHPFTDSADFSGVDNKNYPGFRDDILKRKKDSFVSRMVVGRNESGFTCYYSNELGDEKAVCEMIVIGRNYYQKITRGKEKLRFNRRRFFNRSEKFYRNRQVFGKKGQDKIQNINLAVVGAGGSMNPFLLAAKHIGYRDFLICDFDFVEPINFNRLLGVRDTDIGILKTEVIKREMNLYDDEIRVDTINKKFQDEEVQNKVLNCDIIISGVDNDETRVAIQVFAARHMIPLIDIGSGIYLNNEHTRVESKGAQIRSFIPGNACLVCQGLDLNAVHSKTWLENREAAGYIMDTNETPGSVITINSTIASIALALLTDFVTGFNKIPLQVAYDELNFLIRKINLNQRDDCPICGEKGIVGSGMEKIIIEGGLDNIPFADGVIARDYRPLDGIHPCDDNWDMKFK